MPPSRGVDKPVGGQDVEAAVRRRGRLPRRFGKLVQPDSTHARTVSDGDLGSLTPIGPSRERSPTGSDLGRSGSSSVPCASAWRERRGTVEQTALHVPSPLWVSSEWAPSSGPTLDTSSSIATVGQVLEGKRALVIG